MSTFTGAITRAELTLSDLAIGTGTPYRVLIDDGLLSGTVTRRRNLATSPFVEGAVETTSVRDQTFLPLDVYVTGADLSAIQTNVAALIAAVEQSTYTLTVVFGGATYAWSCQAADYGMRFDSVHSQGKQARVTMNIPRYPIATTGPV